jgi:head-tail adaptor
MALPAGLLDDIITVETATVTQNAQEGSDDYTWPPNGGTSDMIPSAFQYLGSREFPESIKLYAETTARCLVRDTPFTKLIDPATHRIQFDGMIWDITGSTVLDTYRTTRTIELTNKK